MLGFNYIPHNRPTLGREEKKAAIQVLQSSWLAQGKEVEHFENDFCDFLGLPQGSAIAVSSGTAALYLALIALDAQDKNIASPVYSCTALRNATALAGGNLLLTDSHIHSPNMNIHAIDSTAHIAIIPHMYGLPQDFSTLNRKISIIEDCAQSLGATVNQVPVGLQGDIGIYSFYATKLITSGGQGGMIVSKNPTIIEKLKDYRLYDRRFDDLLRFNFQMTDLQAAIGRAQLKQFPKFQNRRSDIFQQYKEANFPLLDATSDMSPVRFRAILQTTKQFEILTALSQNNISAVVPLQEIELLGPKEHYPNAYSWTQNTVSLPIYPSLKDKEVQRIIRIVKSILS
ncbi:DegT/DnrJ/EryC1/StrS aminotransferase family protein [Solibacillus sp. CAU 1738]|uniref:DegT/DnrJ/EryC1/StrS family aminotransferase n=1 Tax=Solibacillus sp. CAU 1738 TaxID=3140363 RepID=UPI003260F215